MPVLFPVFIFGSDAYTANAEATLILTSGLLTLAIMKDLASSVKSASMWIEFNQEIRKQMSQCPVGLTEEFAFAMRLPHT